MFSCATSLTFKNDKGQKIGEMEYTRICIKNDSIFGESKESPIYRDSVTTIEIIKSPHPVLLAAGGFVGAFALVSLTRPKCKEDDGDWDLFDSQKVCEEKNVGISVLAAMITGGILPLITLPKKFEMNQLKECETETERNIRIQKEQIESFERFNKKLKK